ncbi:MAG: hypothetical protein AAB874_04910 [Patescibacteria group bacterium]
MTILRDKQVTGGDTGSWYPDEGVTDRDQAIAYLAQYFPDILTGANSVGLVFQKAHKIILAPKLERTHDEPFMAIANSGGDIHTLRYFYPDESKWELQYILGYPNTKFVLAWEAPKGHNSRSVYGNYVDQVDFKYSPDGGRLRVRSELDGRWNLETSIYVSDLSKQLFDLSQSIPAGVQLIHFNTRDRLLVVDVKVSTGFGRSNSGKISFPHTVTPSRF